MLEKIEIDDIVAIAKVAGAAVMEIYKRDFAVEYKDDKSPLTEADKKSNAIICDSLKNLYPEIPILSEENKATAYADRKEWEYFWLIDPIDGTKEFIKKNGEFTVNIALIHKDTPVLGVVYAPALNDIYYAKKESGAFKNGQKLPIAQNSDTFKAVASKSHMTKETEEFINAIETDKKIEIVSIGSSLKLCMVAEGSADIYPRLGPTMEWDTAAAHAVVLESKKSVLDYETKEALVYNKENLLNPWFIVS